MTMTVPAPSLVAELRAGQPEAFAELNARFRPMIVALARRCGLPYDDAEDVAQETLIAAYRSIGDLTEPAALAGWIRTTATRKAWQMSGSKRRCVERLAPLAVPARNADPDEHLIRDENRRRVAAAVRSLSRRDQLVLSLTVTADPPIPYTMIAERLGCAIGSIGPFRRRALERLEKAIGRRSTRNAA